MYLSAINIIQEEHVLFLFFYLHHYTDITSTHNELIDIVNNSNFEILIAYGVNTCVAAKHFNCRGNLQVICCDNRSSLNKSIKEYVNRGDLVLFKASHSTGLEKSLMHCFPKSYISKTLEYYWPQFKWRLKVLFN